MRRRCTGLGVVVCPYLTLTNATAGPLTGKLGLYVLLCKCTCSTGEAVRIVLPKTLLRALARQGPRVDRTLSFLYSFFLEQVPCMLSMKGKGWGLGV